MPLQRNDRDELIEICFSFVSWLGTNCPEIKDEIRLNIGSTFGEYIRKYPTSFWGDVGDRSYDQLVFKTSSDESILDKIIWYLTNSNPEISGEILVGFVEGHMFKRPDSPLANELGKMIGRDLSGLC